MNFTLSLATKKQGLHPDHRKSRNTLYPGLGCSCERTSENMQACLEKAPQARLYYSDAFPVYDALYYGAPYELRTDKRESYSIEAVNADLRHYLKRLSRKSRFFPRCPHASRCALQIFFYCYNQRQLRKRLYPAHPCNLTDFLHFPV